LYKIILFIFSTFILSFADTYNYEWNKLLHYYENENQVVSPEFFLSNTNNPTPEEELASTVRILNNTNIKQFACNFPARFIYLKENNFKIPNFNLKECKKLNKFIKNFNKNYISIVFSSEYINNPSSAFGHTMLVFNDSLDSLETGDTIHFAAKTSKKDSFFKYSYKGFNGKYNGFFIREPFFKKIYEYNILEQRHMYIYTLDFSKKDIKKLLYHLYEIRKASFRYYFLNGNCSTQVTDLLNITTDRKRNDSSYFLPIDTINAFSNNIVKLNKFVPLVNKLNYLINKMSKTEKKIFYQIKKDTLQISNNTPDIVKQALNYDSTFNFRRFHKIHSNYNDIMNQNFTPINTIDNIPNPINRAKPSYLGIGFANKKIILSYRPLFLDLYDVQFNKMQESEIKTLAFDLEFLNQSTYLKKLDLINIKSLSLQTLFYKPISWSLYSGLLRENKSNDLRLNNEVGVGRTIDVLKNTNLSLLLNIGIENTRPFLKPSLNLTTYLSNKIKIGTSSYYKRYIHNEYYKNELFTSIKKDSFLYTLSYSKEKSINNDRYLFSIKYNF
jgi:hypothetical protein